jgi:RNA polymerase sigma-70 factor (ECF subfamily)
MTPPELAADDPFVIERTRLVTLAYRMLGSRGDAEDVVQEVGVRWWGAERAAIERPAAWLTTVTTRLSIDRLRRARREREHYVGPWLPEPVVEAADDRSPLADHLTLGFLVVLDTLSPVERAVFLLAEVFDQPFREIAVVVGKSEANCRQIAHRARTKVAGARRRADRDPAADELVARLVAALAAGDQDGLIGLLAPDVVLISDGGAKAHAARRPVVTPYRVARLLSSLAKRAMPFMTEIRPVRVNGEPGLAVWRGAQPMVLLAFEADASSVRAVRIIINPDKLAILGPPT